MLEPEQASEIEASLAEILGISVEALRDYLSGNIRAGGARRTGIKYVRGSHAGTYVRDKDGMDILPAGYSLPA